MKSKRRETLSLIQHGPEDPRKCWVRHFDHLRRKAIEILFNEFIALKKEFKIPEHRIIVIICLDENNKQRILYEKK